MAEEEEEEESALRAEVERLSAELAETSEQKVQAARYGLAVLEERRGLQQRLTELESEHEATIQELERLKEAFADVCSNQRKVAADGESREETLLREAARKEGDLVARIAELQTESRQTKAALTNTLSENERLTGELQEARKVGEALEAEKAQLRDEMKEFKIRESQQLQDCTELEEENISLQKLVSVLRENQVEFEGLKHDLRQREEDIEILHGQLEEATRLRAITERNLEEALEAVRSEREQKNALRQDLLAHANAVPTCGLHPHLQELALNDGALGPDELDSGFQPAEGSGQSLASRDPSPPRQPPALPPCPGLVSDLFTELSLSEVQKLRQQLAQPPGLPLLQASEQEALPPPPAGPPGFLPLLGPIPRGGPTPPVGRLQPPGLGAGRRSGPHQPGLPQQLPQPLPVRLRRAPGPRAAPSGPKEPPRGGFEEETSLSCNQPKAAVTTVSQMIEASSLELST
ncbi:LOW QUALITY PROTEIN: protein bicaudal D homolog 2-like [Stegostoma tigrinum]|uniref:LOW QUALITY PROTEIN: protein bicaudal D homolog 2-like n=1 Tax=Stegostoma tigrinum TaxID=3053191 RepID=UPI00286FD122|nr:LOW QUALITY PROTEIN: protein bicaudal D homolog 2-like [Stegostoma tigrinum]